MAQVPAAVAREFHTDSPGASLSGSQNESGPDRFVVQKSEVVCKTTKWSGKFPESKTASSLSLHPEYSNCSGFGFSEASVNTAGCLVKFTASGGASLNSCTAGGILITASGGLGKCVVEIPNQGEQPLAEYTSTELTLIQVLMLIWASTHGWGAPVITDSGFCPLSLGASEVFLSGGADIVANKEAASVWIE